MITEVEVDTYWNSLADDPIQTLLPYHDSGISEQFHSEIKNDMALERLPSEHFSTNSYIITLSLLAYNLLLLCGQESPREDNDNLSSRVAYRKEGRKTSNSHFHPGFYLHGRSDFLPCSTVAHFF